MPPSSVISPAVTCTRLFRRLLHLWLVALCVGGCQFIGTNRAQQEIAAGAKAPLKEGVNISPAELAQINQAFADRYVLQYASACDAIAANNPNRTQRRLAQEIKTSGATSVYDIVTNGDPYTQVLDLTVAVTLQSIVWIDENQAEEQFGPRGDALIKASRITRLEIWEIAAKIFPSQELENLDYLIWDWRRHNPNIREPVNVRFSDFAAMRGASGQPDNRAAGLFAQIDQARQSVDEARLLAERALYLGKRMPLLVAWRTEATINDITADPQFIQALGDLHTFASVADALPATLDAQRAGILADLDKRQPALDATIKNARDTLAQADTLTTNLKSFLVELQRTAAAIQDLAKQGDAIAAKYMPPSSPSAAIAGTPPAASAPAGPGQPLTAITSAPAGNPAAPAHPAAPPFDIRDYTAALAQASTTVHELNNALTSSRDLLDSQAWTKRIEEVNRAADGRVLLASAQSQALMDKTFHRIYIALGVLFLVLITYRLTTSWVLHKLRIGHKQGGS